MQAIKKDDFLYKFIKGSVVLFSESQFVTYWGEIWASQIAWKIEKGAIWRRQNDEKPFLIFAFLHVSPTQPKSLYLSHVVVSFDINKPERVFGLQVRWKELDTFKILEIFRNFFWRNFFVGIFLEEFFVKILR